MPNECPRVIPFSLLRHLCIIFAEPRGMILDRVYNPTTCAAGEISVNLRQYACERFHGDECGSRLKCWIKTSNSGLTLASAAGRSSLSLFQSDTWPVRACSVVIENMLRVKAIESQMTAMNWRETRSTPRTLRNERLSRIVSSSSVVLKTCCAAEQPELRQSPGSFTMEELQHR